MTEKNRVLRSFETPDGQHCVDLFIRVDGTFGFENFRRDPEDASGWFAVGYFGERIFSDESQAMSEAKRVVPWLVELSDQKHQRRK